MCKVLNVNRQTYYNHVTQPKNHHVEVVVETDAVCEAFQESRGTYGQRRIKAELDAQTAVGETNSFSAAFEKLPVSAT
jgi:hypothetical protein